jgi:hypothetical protein
VNRLVVSLALLAFPLSAFADDVVPLDLGGGQYLATVDVPSGVESVCMDAPGLPSQCGAPIMADCGNPFFPGGCTFLFDGTSYSVPSNHSRVFAAKFPLEPAQRVTVRFSCAGCREATGLAGILRDAIKPLAGIGVPLVASPFVPPVPPPDPMPIRPAVQGVATCAPPSALELTPLKLASGQYLLVANFPTEADSICFKVDGGDSACTNSAGRTAVQGGTVTVDGLAYNDNGHPIAFASAFVRKMSLAAGQVVHVEAYSGPAKTLAAKVYRVPANGGSPQPQPQPQPDPNTPPAGGGGGGSASASCAAIRAADPSVAYCEDFEDAALRDLSGWSSRYGEPFDHCVGGNCVGAVVRAGECVPGDTGCVFGGNASMAMRLDPGREGGTVGLRRIFPTPQRRVAVTMAWRVSPGYPPRDHGVKNDRFEESGGNFEIFGESSLGADRSQGTRTTGNRFPFGVPLDIEPNSCVQFGPPLGPAVCSVGVVANTGFFGENDVHYDLLPGPGYDFPTSIGTGRWACMQAAFTNFGQPGMTARYWVNGKLVIDIANIDGTKLRAALHDGVTTFDFVHFFNDGYSGSSTGARYEDNIVVSTGPEPVSCAAIGFGASASGASAGGATAASVPAPAPVVPVASALFSSGFEVADTAFTGTRGGAAIQSDSCKDGGRCARLDTAALTNDQTAFFYHSLGNQPYDSLYVGADFMFPKGFSFQPVQASDGRTQSNDLKALIFEVLPDSAGRGHRLFLNFKAHGDPSHGQLAALASASEDRWAFANQDIVADGAWHRVEFEAVRKPNGVPGRFRAWLDDKLVLDDAYKLCLAECAPVGELKVGAYINFASTLPQHWYVDNVAFGRSRTELRGSGF